VAGYAWKPDRLYVPDGITPELRRIAIALDLASHELTRLLGLYELYQALSAPQFLDSMSGSTALAGISTMRMSLIRNALTITVALFDEDQRSVHLRRIATTITDRRHYASIEAAHVRSGVEYEMDHNLERLEVKCRSMKKGRFPIAFGKLEKVRNTMLAHYDFENQPDMPFMRDLQYCMVTALRVADLSNRILLMRSFTLLWMRDQVRKQACALRDAISLGARQDANPNNSSDRPKSA